MPARLVHDEGSMGNVATWRNISIRCWFMARVSHQGMTKAAALPGLGQIAPKM